MATSVASSAIVPEVLRNDNYEDWRACIKNYLLAQDLWDDVENPKNDGDDDLEWRKKNAAALHAIQISCSPNILSQIRDKNLAKEAWDFLARDRGIITSNQLEDYGIDDYPEYYMALMDAAERGDWQCANVIFTGQQRSIISGMALYKALDVAILAGHEKFVEELVKVIQDIDLEVCNPLHVKALNSAAVSGSIQLAKCIFSKNENLLRYEDNNGMIPVTLAAGVSTEEMTRYLYSITPAEVLTEKEGIHGATLLTHWIAAKQFDSALHLLQQRPELAFRRDKDGITPIYALARVPSAFKGGYIKLLRSDWLFAWLLMRRPVRERSWLKDVIYYIFTSSYRLGIDIEEFLKIKSTYIQAKKLLQLLCKDITKYGNAPRVIQEALLEAVSNGIIEFFDSIIEANPDMLWTLDKHKRNLFMLAVQHRQLDIFNSISRLEGQKKKLASCIDSMGNSMLHIAGFLAPSTILQLIPGKSFQMETELQWFKRVEKIVHPKHREARNIEGFTPRELFTVNHINLRKEAEKWVKETARSGTVVGALIMTITFTAIFTVPGGNNQSTGYPIFSDRTLFAVFIIADIFSMAFSSCSVMRFFEILASSHAEVDFLENLPHTILFGIDVLKWSLCALIVAFWAALNIMKKGKIWKVITSLLACYLCMKSFLPTLNLRKRRQ